ncbi:hypothetical protein B0H17DRAFT_1338120 [Mycena rosella]|uniref:Uncharacterized protein n=1 Tax=Mycena rosella TaxID=1033263 RepID=A0AAD7G4R5_MYCRO|nr:hypothetical protein B0H17DRAFT_1338120 [Mycena rosella]
MASGSRKQITYAHKRNRPKPSKTVSNSSPLEELGDTDQYMSHAELSGRPLKRARHSSNPEVSSSKKLKSSAYSHQSENSYPSALPDEQTSKLNSSRDIAANPNPDKPSSPRRVVSRTASGTLKENAAAHARKQDTHVDNPFRSLPSSAVPSLKTPLARPSPGSALGRTLSETSYNPNISQSAGTPSLSSRTHSRAQTRRPSALGHPRPAHWILNPFTFNFPTIDPFSVPNEIAFDFIHPPSLSLFNAPDPQFFDDAQGNSTPARKKPADGEHHPSVAADEVHEPDLTITLDAMDADLVPSGLKALSTRERSPWLSDSLISPPPSQEWNRPPQEAHPNPSPLKDPTTFDDISLGLGLAAFGTGAEFPAVQPSSRPEHTADGDLKPMIDGLALAAKNRLLNSRARSFDSPIPSATADKIHPSRTSEFSKTALALPTRTVLPIQREGRTVRAPPAVPRNHPKMPSGSPDPLDAFWGLVPAPMVWVTRQVGGKGKAKQVVLDDEDEDELLLKPGFNA